MKKNYLAVCILLPILISVNYCYTQQFPKDSSSSHRKTNEELSSPLGRTKKEPSITPGQKKNDSTNISHKIILTDGTEINAKILSQDNTNMKILTVSGIEMTIPLDKVKEIKALSGEMVNGEYWRFDPNRTRLFFAPTARPLDAGEGYFSAYEIFFPMLSIGVTNFIALSGGMSLLPGLPMDEQLLYANLKVTPVHTDDFSLSVGAFYTHFWDFYSGILYGVGTVGNNMYSFTAGLGFGYSDDGFTDTPFLMLGGDIRLGNSIKLISENWIISGYGMYSFGLRFFGDNVAADFGLFGSVSSRGEGFPFFPWIGFAYNFGR